VLRSGFFGSLAFLAALVASMCLAPGCYTWRSASADRTVWEELPNDPRPELWVEGTPRVPVVFEGVVSAFGDLEPALDERATEHYRRLLREAHVFTDVLDHEREGIEGLSRVRLERVFQEDDHTSANMTKAVTVPGLLGYRFGLTATFRLELERPGSAPETYEARSVLTRIYHHADRRDEARRVVYYEAERANSEAILHQLRADVSLFDPVVPLDDPRLAPL
jgi:hypothetical protein